MLCKAHGTFGTFVGKYPIKLIKIILNEGIVEVSKHCLMDSMPKRDVDIEDIIAALMNGQIIRQAEWDNNYNNWKYRIEGFDVSKEELTVITIIFSSSLSLFVITVF